MARVLVLDDQEDVAATVVLLAESLGHEARHTSDAAEFLALSRSWQPTHLVLDLAMPEVDGVDVLGALAEQGSQARVVISSGADPRVVDAAGRLGRGRGLDMAGVLRKPFGSAELAPLLREAAAPDTDGAPPDPAPRLEVADLKSALLDGSQIGVAYQPKIDCATGALVGFEALARWLHPEHGHVSPMVFVPMAEEEGLIDRLTDHVFELALGWRADLPEVGGDTTLALNVSALSFTEPGYGRRLSERCRRAGVDPHLVTVELTETRTPLDQLLLLQELTQLRMHGFRLSLDDFGTGYSTMAQLARLPFSEIKVDRSFVMTALASAESRSVVGSVVDLGHSFGLTTVAEGVEDEATLRLVRELGADLVQGFHIARPLPPDEARAWTTG